jgi:hypothetical protein
LRSFRGAGDIDRNGPAAPYPVAGSGKIRIENVRVTRSRIHPDQVQVVATIFLKERCRRIPDVVGNIDIWLPASTG